MSEEELDAIFNQPRQLSPEALEKLGELQAQEIELALVVNGCGGGFADQRELIQEVVADYEQRFLDENAELVEEFRAEG